MAAWAPELPQIATALPTRMHPRAEAITERGIRWVRTHLPLDSDARKLFIEEGHCLWVCLLFPDGAQDRVQSICDLTLLLFATDDALVDGATDGHALYDAAAAVLAGREPPHDSPWTGALQDVWRRFDEDMTRSQLDRLQRAIELLYRAALQERRLRAAHHLPSFADYVALRKTSVGASIYFVLAEYARAVELDAAQLRDRAMSALRDVACEHLILANDLFSLRKELSMGDPINAVAVLQRERRLGESQATALVGKLVEACERTFVDRRAAIAASPLGADPAVRLTIAGIGDLLAGNLRWSYITPRYHGPGFRWKGMTPTEAALLASGDA